MVPGYPRLDPRAEDFWPKFWKLYLAARAPDAGNRDFAAANTGKLESRHLVSYNQIRGRRREEAQIEPVGDDVRRL